MDRLILFRRVRGASLVEVLVAVVIISVVFGLAIGIYLNVQQSGFSIKKVAADACLQESITTAMAEKRIEPINKACGDFIIVSAVIDVVDRPGLKAMHWEARDGSGVLLVERKLFVYAAE